MRILQKFFYLPLLLAVVLLMIVLLVVVKMHGGNKNDDEANEKGSVCNITNGEFCYTDVRHAASHTTSPSSIGGHNYIDLGLKSGTLWAECNVGAENTWEYGDYFAWGEKLIKRKYPVYDSKWYGVSYSSLEERGVIDRKGNLTSAYDVARAMWGSNWRMPTSEEIYELVSLKSDVTIVNGVRGRRFHGLNGAYLFLPFSGYRLGCERNDVNLCGDYWFATVSENEWRARCLRINSRDAQMWSDYRYFLFSVRAVVSKK